MAFLIIGGDGLLGRSLGDRLKKTGERVVVTSRRKETISDSRIYLDLLSPSSSWQIPDAFHTAFFCAAITSVEKCRTDPGKSRMINVEQTVKMASRLVERDISILFPSTNLVFNGRKPTMKADDPVDPLVEYGKQKAEVEKRLMELGGDISIVRFTKILSPESELINQWIGQLRSRKKIFPFVDMVLSPVSIDFACRVMLKIAESGSNGIWQVSAEKDITYDDLARYIARKMGADERTIQPVSAINSERSFESIPEYTTLNTDRIEKELGIYPQDVWDIIDSLFLNQLFS